jgi:hypothetical protein
MMNVRNCSEHELIDAEQENRNAASWLPEDILQTEVFYALIRGVGDRNMKRMTY